MKSLESVFNLSEEQLRNEQINGVPFPEAACYLGVKLLETNPIDGFYALAYSVERGFADAYAEIGRCYLEGIGHPRDLYLAQACVEQFKEESLLDLEHPAKHQEFVDLGLPSGTLWATCNLGACSPLHLGKTFNYSSDSDSIDHAASFDTAWKTPSVEQFRELVSQELTESRYIRKGLVWGWEITSRKNGNKVFFPLGIQCVNQNGASNDESAALWTSSLYKEQMKMAVFANGSHPFCGDNYGHSHKLPIRPVK